MTLRDLGYAAISGLLLGALFAPFSFEALAWVALMPLLWSLDRKDPAEAFVLGFTAGFVGYAIIVWWVVVTMVNYGGIPTPVAWLLALTLAAYIALYVGLFGYLLAWIAPGEGFARLFMAPVVWVATEILRAYVLSGFPWALLGYSQYRVLPVVQIADLVGVYGISFFIVLINAFFWKFFRHPDRAPLALLGSGALVAALVVGYGYLRLHEVPGEGGKPVTVGIVQPDTRPLKKWVPGFREKIVGDLEKLTQELAQKRDESALKGAPPLIIWPEASAPFVYSDEPGWQKRLSGISRRAGAYVLFGSLYSDRSAGPPKLYNSAYLLDPGGQSLGRYDKMHLVPFGEYVPLRWLLFFVEKFVPVIGKFGEGGEPRLFRVPGGRFGVLICFEIIFPRVVRRMRNAGFLVNITNDAWFGRSAASEQHLSMAAMRAVEFRLPIVRSANTGISSIIDATGAIRYRSPLFEKWTKLDTISPRKESPTLYARTGDVFAFACALAALLLTVLKMVRGRRRVWYD